MVKAQTDGLWVNKDHIGISVPIVECGQDAPHFYDLSEKDRMAASCWLLLSIAPWDASGRDWVYRVDRDSPCAMLAPNGNGGLIRTDRSCHVKSAGVS